MTKFDRMLSRMIPTPAEDDEPTLTILDGFGRDWEVAAPQFDRLTHKPVLFLGARPKTEAGESAQSQRGS